MPEDQCAVWLTDGRGCHTPGVREPPLKPLRGTGELLHKEMVEHRNKVAADLRVGLDLGFPVTCSCLKTKVDNKDCNIRTRGKSPTCVCKIIVTRCRKIISNSKPNLMVLYLLSKV